MNNKSSVILVLGNGGHSRALQDVFLQITDYSISLGGSASCRCLDDTRKTNWAKNITTKNCLLAVGQIESPEARKEIVAAGKEHDKTFVTLISPRAYVSPDARLGEGVQVMHNAVINTCAKIGSHVIVNTSAVVEHDAQVGIFTHISTGAVVNGGSKVGKDCFIGSNAVISNNVTICDDCIIGAGSVVIKDINDPGTYVGNPARKIR